MSECEARGQRWQQFSQINPRAPLLLTHHVHSCKENEIVAGPDVTEPTSYQMCHGLSLMASKHNSWDTLFEDMASSRSILLAKNNIGIFFERMSERERGWGGGGGQI